MSDLEFRPIHNFSSNNIIYKKCKKHKYRHNSTSCIHQCATQNHTSLGLLGYCETSATLHAQQEKAYRVDILKLVDIC